ncbi:MAG: pimeloyl-ACP methyl ester carboxylesterase [Chitinophagales bacterium]|jgi:pimeloyl-ACP methyl ester carboxylesterase
MKKWILISLLILFLIPIILLALRKDNIITRQQAIEFCSSPQSKYYTWENSEVHYIEQGAGDTTILMIHGFGGSHKNFTSVAKILEKDYRVISVDLPAFGLSEVPTLEIADEDMFAYYQAFIRNSISTLNIEYYHVMGNSLGGWVAWDLAAENDSSLLSLTLLGSAGFGMEKVRATATGWMTSPFGKFIFKKGVPFRMSEANAERCLSDHSKMVEEKVKANYYMINKEGTFPWMLRMAGSPALPDTASIAQIECPSLIIWGDEDAIVPVEHADKFAALLKNHQKIIYEYCGHTPQIEYPERVVEDWQKFVLKVSQ